jgi:hypothetical protein
MKTTSLILFALLASFCAHAQNQRPTIVLTSRDVDTNHVRLATHPDTPYQNLVLRLPGKTSEELYAIDRSHPRVRIARDGVVVIEAEIAWALWDGKGSTSTNCVGLILGFRKYDDAKIAQKTLRGD